MSRRFIRTLPTAHGFHALHLDRAAEALAWVHLALVALFGDELVVVDQRQRMARVRRDRLAIVNRVHAAAQARVVRFRALGQRGDQSYASDYNVMHDKRSRVRRHSKPFGLLAHHRGKIRARERHNAEHEITVADALARRLDVGLRRHETRSVLFQGRAYLQ